MEPLLDGRYRLEEILGKGGMGWVQRAYDMYAKQWVAIKFLDTKRSQSQLSTAFSWEVQAVARLAHPNAVELYDFGRTGHGVPYIVMALSPGSAINTVAKNAFQWPTLCALLFQLLGVLSHAHARGVFHHDLKPSNILIHRDRAGFLRAQIIDFGIAAVLNRPIVGDGEGPQVLVGTASYLAPEAIRNFALYRFSAALDIYALGVIAYELAFGERPFQAEDTAQLLRMHRLTPIPQRQLRSDFNAPPAAISFIHKMLAKNPRKRFETASEVLAQLKQIAPPEAVTGRVDTSGLPPARWPGLEESGLYLTGSAGLVRNHPHLLQVRPPKFSGRDEEMAYLWGRLTETAVSKVPHVVLLDGESGVGMSRLVREFAQRAHEGGRARVAVVHYTLSGLESVEGLRTALLRMLGYTRPDRRALWEEIDEDLEWLRLDDRIDERVLLDLLAPAAEADGSDTDSHYDWVGTYLEVLFALAAMGPVLLVLEDISSSVDKRGIEMLEFLLRTRMRCPVLVILTARAPEAIEHDITRLSQYEGFSRTSIDRMSRRATTSLLNAVMPLDAELRDQILDLANGSPTFAVEALRLLIRGESLTRNNGDYALIESAKTLPGTFKEGWQQRWQTVTETSEANGLAGSLGAVLLRAAVIGQPFTFAALERVLQLEGREDLREALGESWATWIEEGLWEQVSPGRAVFTQHSLWSAVLWAGEPELVRDLHRLSAQSRVEHPIVSPPAEVLAIARHYEMAEMAEDAFPFYMRAARHASQVSRHTAVVEYCRRGADLILAAGVGEFDRRWGQLYKLLSNSLNKLGRYEDGEAVAWRLEERAGHWSDALFRASAFRLIAQSRLAQGGIEGVETLILQAREVFFEQGVFSEHGKCELLLGQLWLDRRDAREVRGCFESARESFARIDDIRGIAHAFLSEAQLLIETGDQAGAQDLVLQASDRFKGLGDRAGLAACFRFHASILRMRNDPDRARAALERAGKHYRAVGSRQGVAQVLLEEGRFLASHTRVEDAYEHFKQALEEFNVLRCAQDAAITRMELIQLAVTAGEYDQAAGAIEQLLPEISRQSGTRGASRALVLLGRCRAEQRRWPEVDQAVCDGAAMLQQIQLADESVAKHLESIGETAAASRQITICRTALEAARRIWYLLGRADRINKVDHALMRLT